MMSLSVVQNICVWVIPVLFAITFHELAHGYVAFRLGDPTARMLGRLTLNPIKHIDPFGTVIMPLALGILTNFTMIFGWAKPVPISSNNLKNPRRDLMLIALAGPLSNLSMALFWAALLKLSLSLNIQLNAGAKFLFFAARAGIIINVILFVLNLLPVPPLDGSRVVSNLIPPKWAYHYDRLEPYGLFILILLMVTGILGLVLTPLYQTTLNLLLVLFNL